MLLLNHSEPDFIRIAKIINLYCLNQYKILYVKYYHCAYIHLKSYSYVLLKFVIKFFLSTIPKDHKPINYILIFLHKTKQQQQQNSSSSNNNNKNYVLRNLPGDKASKSPVKYNSIYILFTVYLSSLFTL